MHESFKHFDDMADEYLLEQYFEHREEYRHDAFQAIKDTLRRRGYNPTTEPKLFQSYVDQQGRQYICPFCEQPDPQRGVEYLSDRIRCRRCNEDLPLELSSLNYFKSEDEAAVSRPDRIRGTGVEDTLEGIGGYLWLIAVIIVLSVVITASELTGQLSLKNPLYLVFLVVDLILAVIVGLLFMGRRSLFPRVFLIWIWLGMLYSLIEIVTGFSPLDAAGFLAGVGFAVVLTLYIVRSRRVRNTFTKPFF